MLRPSSQTILSIVHSALFTKHHFVSGLVAAKENNSYRKDRHKKRKELTEKTDTKSGKSILFLCVQSGGTVD
jgi:hypothetical protein